LVQGRLAQFHVAAPAGIAGCGSKGSYTVQFTDSIADAYGRVSGNFPACTILLHFQAELP
ncbi:MAG: hypothetical protein QM612_01655, partial [Thermomonas sp.]|uniref:hypothetical protein n=1 Tax=Thermomonas sp. TaxID=1971895 RepID=UPI0039E21F5C